MTKKHHVLIYTFLGLALVIAAAAAVDGFVSADRSARRLEGAYAQRLLEAQDHLQAMGVKLQKIPVTTDAAACVELLAGVSRQADGVAAALSTLPLSHPAMADTVRFCNQMAEYAMGLALRAAAGSLPAADDLDTLAAMRAQCALLSGQFATAQGSMAARSLGFAAASGVFYEPASLDARPLEQVADKDNGMDYPAMIYDGAFSDAKRASTPKALGGREVTQEEAISIARTFVGDGRVARAEAGVPTGGVIACHGVTLTLADGVVLNADVTKQGGRLLWIMPEHAAFTPLLTLEECTQSARHFLQQHGYGEAEATHYQVYDGLAVISFAPTQDGVLLYPDLIKVQLRMDTGELVGFESSQYLMNHTRRAALSPAWTKEQALSRVGDRLQQKAARLCVIPEGDGERLCWEISGTHEGSEYRVYLDAATGQEAEVLLMVDSISGRQAI